LSLTATTKTDLRPTPEPPPNTDEATSAALSPHIMAEARRNKFHNSYDSQDYYNCRMQEWIDSANGSYDWNAAVEPLWYRHREQGKISL
jgi:hypothetical protein